MRVDTLLWRGARLFPHVPAVVDASRSLSHMALASEVARLITVLLECGVRAGDRVAVLSKNRWEHVALFHAAANLDAVFVPLNWRLSTSELQWIIADAAPRVVLAEPPYTVALDNIRSELPDAIQWLALDEAPEGWDMLPPRMAKASPAAPFIASASAHTPVAQIYTSGTTGRPKGALLTHANLLASVMGIMGDFAMRPGQDRHLQVTPLFHVGGMLMTVLCAAQSVTLRLLPEFSPAAAARCLSQEPVTHTLMVPAMLQWLFAERGIDRQAFKHLRFLAYGAAPMPATLLAQAMHELGCAFFQGYGLTETAAMLTILSPDDHREGIALGSDAARLSSAGREMLGVHLKVVDAQGQALPVGEPGEIVAAGACVSPGYWQLPEASAQAHRQGWFWTGDIGVLDEQGYLTIVDRAKDMVIVGGENVYPSEVERVLMTHPDVLDCAVIGVPHAVWGEEVMALVALREGVTMDPRVLIAHCRASLARYKAPTRVELRPAIARNAAGKIEKAKLREPFWAGQQRAV